MDAGTRSRKIRHDPASATWKGGGAHATGAANAWSVIAADPERDLVFVPTGSPSPDYYGGERLGDNRYANSIVALRAATGERVWSFQTVHHDLWDYDVRVAARAGDRAARGPRRRRRSCRPPRPASSSCCDRETGEPIVGVEERPVPARAVAGETASPTQPSPRCRRFGLQHVTPDDAWGLDAAGSRGVPRAIAGARYDGVFTPPSVRVHAGHAVATSAARTGAGSPSIPSARSSSFPVNRLAALVQLIPRERHDPARNEPGWEFAPMRGTPYVMRRRILLSPLGLPCTPPPFGTLVAISLLSGKIVWEVPLGTTRDLVASKIFLPTKVGSGTPNLGGPIVTAGGLVFIGAAMDDCLRAFDIETGRELWKGRLPAGGQATPMTYRRRRPAVRRHRRRRPRQDGDDEQATTS